MDHRPKQTPEYPSTENYEIPGKAASLMIDGAWVKGKVIDSAVKNGQLQHNFLSNDGSVSTVVADENPELRWGNEATLTESNQDLGSAALLQERLGPLEIKEDIKDTTDTLKTNVDAMREVFEGIRNHTLDVVRKIEEEMGINFSSTDPQEFLQRFDGLVASIDSGVLHAESAITKARESNVPSASLTEAVDVLRLTVDLYNEARYNGWIANVLGNLDSHRAEVDSDPDGFRDTLTNMFGYYHEDIETFIKELQ